MKSRRSLTCWSESAAVSCAKAAPEGASPTISAATKATPIHRMPKRLMGTPLGRKRIMVVSRPFESDCMSGGDTDHHDRK
jgi:hypothetical protein